MHGLMRESKVNPVLYATQRGVPASVGYPRENAGSGHAFKATAKQSSTSREGGGQTLNEDISLLIPLFVHVQGQTPSIFFSLNFK